MAHTSEALSLDTIGVFSKPQVPRVSYFPRVSYSSLVTGLAHTV